MTQNLDLQRMDLLPMNENEMMKIDGGSFFWANFLAITGLIVGGILGGVVWAVVGSIVGGIVGATI